MQFNRQKPVILAILDGWGVAKNSEYNAVSLAKTPTMDMLTREFPHGVINASELHVGLPSGQMGNSEVGHMNIGSGRVVMQDLPRIDAAIADGSLAQKPLLKEFIEKVKKATGVVHLLGLLSDGGVHSHQNHIVALADILAKNGLDVKLHLFLDGRDVPPRSALDYFSNLEQSIEGINNISIATVSGRYYAMDRDNRWDRVQKAYLAITRAQGIYFGARFFDCKAAIENFYTQKTTDEFILPSVIGDYRGMNDGDGLLMANFRSDRVRELLISFLYPEFVGFKRPKPTIQFSSTLGMTEYSAKLAPLIPALFPPEPLTNILGEVVANAGLKQLRIAETEKYAHVTFFFNGGRENEFTGEERILVPSPSVATYDLKPEMSAPEVTEKLLEAIEFDKFDLIVVNYANTDMVGHTGDIGAAIKAVETVDNCLGKVVAAALAKGGAVVVTADHGNAEQMFDEETKQAHTAHTINLVPLIIASEELRGKKIKIREGVLGDVAPTVLELLNLPQPTEMTGKSLLV